MTVSKEKTPSPSESVQWVSLDLDAEQQKEAQIILDSLGLERRVTIVPDMLIYGNQTDFDERGVARVATAHASLLWATVSNDIEQRYGVCGILTTPTNQGTFLFLYAERSKEALGREIKGAVPKVNEMIRAVGGTKFVPAP